MRQQVVRLCLVALLGAGACDSGAPSTTVLMGQGGAGGEAGSAGPDFVDCSADTRATPYAAGMKETSLSGAWVVKLLNNTFLVDGKPVIQAPAKGTDSWTIEVDDASGRPADGIVTGVSPYMPDHRHGTTPVAVTTAGTGTYTLTPLYLYMSGYWEITIGLTGSGAGTDSAMFPICIPQ